MSDEKISAMPAAAALTGAELVPLVQGGANVKSTTQDIANLTPGSAVSVTAVTPNVVITPSPGTGAFTVGTTAPINPQTGVNYTVLTGDAGKVITLSNANPIAVTLPQAGSAGFASGWSTTIVNLGPGTATITTTTSSINGLGQTAVLETGGSLSIASDGTNWVGLLAPAYFEGTWVPTDASGAGLSLTIVEAKYTLIGRIANVTCHVSYPATADGSQVKIGGFPFAVGPNIAPIIWAIVSGIGFVPAPLGAGNNIATFYANASAAPLPNSTMSGRDLFFSLEYQIA